MPHRPHRLRHPVNIEHHESRDASERLADQVVGFMGSWHTVAILERMKP